MEIICSIFSILYGAAIWYTAANYWGRVEPWAYSVPIYVALIFMGGFLAAIIAGKPFHKLVWVWPLLIILGQLGYVLLNYDLGAKIVLVIMPLFAFSVISLIGSLLGVKLTTR